MRNHRYDNTPRHRQPQAIVIAKAVRHEKVSPSLWLATGLILTLLCTLNLWMQFH